ncbi:MAG: TerC family protein [Acidobacteria bacterium]|nr:TerC family protein [Acidobacteriota bacterium]
MTSVESPWFWGGFIGVVLMLLALDLGVFHRRAHSVGPREAMLWSLVWVTLSLSFGTWIYLHLGSQKGLEFFTGYLIEYALSVDNVFVFVLIFSYFAVPRQLHHRVLFWGILGALVMRAAFILIGAALLHAFHWVIYVFGAFLIYTGIKIFRHGDTKVEPDRNPVVRFFRRVVPMVAHYGGGGFFVRHGGRWLATPLAVVLVTVETTDVVFAIDSIPAIFAITADPFIVYTSNVCAILGLRSMYFLIAAVVNRFAYLSTGLGVVLMFVGVKMVLSDICKIPIFISLGVVAAILVASVAASLLWPPRGTQVPPVPRPTLAGPEPGIEPDI